MDDIKAILKEVLSKLDSIDKRVDSIDQRVDSIDKRVESLDQRLDSMDSEVKSVRKTVDKHSIIFEEVNKKLSVLGEVQQNHIESVDRNHSDVYINIREDIGLIKSAVTKNAVESAEQYEDLTNSINRVQESTDRISEDTEEMKLEIERITEKTARNRVDILEMKKVKFGK